MPETTLLEFYKTELPAAVSFLRCAFPAIDHHSAEDIVQEALLRVITHRWSQIRNPKAFLLTAMRNLAIDYLRSRTREPLLTDNALEAMAPAVDDELGTIDLMNAVDAAIARMPARQRAVFLLHTEGHQASEIGDLLGITPSTAHVQVHKARARLRQMLSEDHGGDN
ncbi:RNA polymerase sigma factor [Streptomyces sp. NPDC059092]|uniref:RNA polymerase sigma factor n=1 Tax=Streptomyces sp. NPDC059092 TaxID=3346725 RepID=UPI0036BCE7F0